eukprot:UN2602
MCDNLMMICNQLTAQCAPSLPHVYFRRAWVAIHFKAKTASVVSTRIASSKSCAQCTKRAVAQHGTSIGWHHVQWRDDKNGRAIDKHLRAWSNKWLVVSSFAALRECIRASAIAARAFMPPRSMLTQRL